MVRFGNVLGSSESVIPVFKEQILNSLPITVTHPGIIRYFMTIPEAAQLVIQAGAMGKGGMCLCWIWGNEYIGSHTCVELIKKGFEPVIIDNESNSKEAFLDRIETITDKHPVFM